ncbi:Leucine rich repeat protein bspa family [Entamoeba marina]
MQGNTSNHKQLDSYSLLIYYINTICVCKKFKETTEKLRFNPIPIESKRLFPKIQTQYLYDKYDLKIDEIENYEIWYKVNYDQYLEDKKENIKFHYVIFTVENRMRSENIPIIIKGLGDACFMNCTSLQSINLTSTIQLLGSGCFSDCSSLSSIDLPFSLTLIGTDCFNSCTLLKKLNYHHH